MLHPWRKSFSGSCEVGDARLGVEGVQREQWLSCHGGVDIDNRDQYRLLADWALRCWVETQPELEICHRRDGPEAGFGFGPINPLITFFGEVGVPGTAPLLLLHSSISVTGLESLILHQSSSVKSMSRIPYSSAFVAGRCNATLSLGSDHGSYRGMPRMLHLARTCCCIPLTGLHHSRQDDGNSAV